MRLPIPQAMLWKYGVKCGKTIEGDDIAVWESEIISQPSKEQIEIDVAEYTAYLASPQYVDDIKENKFNAREVAKALALTIMDELNILRAAHSLPALTGQEMKTKVKNRM